MLGRRLQVFGSTVFIKKIEGGEDANIPSTTKIEDGCFLSPYKVFLCRLLSFGSILSQGLLSNIMFLFWICGSLLPEKGTLDHDTREYLHASEYVKIIGCTLYASSLSTMRRIRNDPIYWRLRWIYFHSIMGTRFLISVGF